MLLVLLLLLLLFYEAFDQLVHVLDTSLSLPSPKSVFISGNFHFKSLRENLALSRVATAPGKLLDLHVKMRVPTLLRILLCIYFPVS